MALIDTASPCTAGLATTPEAFDDVIDLYLRYSPDTLTKLDTIQQRDPSFAIGHIFKGYQLKMASDPRLAPALSKSLEAARVSADTHQERAHVEALSAWCDDDCLEASARLAEILASSPTDLIALKAANHLHFYRGDAKGMRDAILNSLPHWPSDHPWRSFVVGMLSFGHEECGDYEQALACGETAVAAEPLDMWAAHSVAHVYQMQCNFDQGVNWIEQCSQQWQQTNNFYYHLTWHKALMLLDSGHAEAALSVYDLELRDCLQDDFYLDICNAASLLWRLELVGQAVGSRWHELANYLHRSQDQELVFITLHYLIVAVKNRDVSQIDLALANLDAWSQRQVEQGAVCGSVGLQLGRALDNLAKGKLQEGLFGLHAVLPELYKIGGSHAQRALFSDIYDHYQKELL